MNQAEIKRKQIEICFRIPGMITLLILGNMAGDNGIAYLAAAMESFLLFWTLTGGEVADVLGRALRGRSAKGQYRNAAKMRSTALAFESGVGLAGSMLMLLFAGLIAQKVFQIPYSTPLIMILVPALLLRTISAVLLGYFQGEGTELPTVISSAIRQLCILLLGLLFGKLFRGYGEKVSLLLGQDNFTAMYGGMGIALAISVTEAIVLVFLILVYLGSRSNFLRRSNEGMRVTDSFGSQVRVLYRTLFPRILAGIMQALPLILGLVFYRKVLGTDTDIEKYGIFYGKYIPLCYMVIFPVSALLLGASSKAAVSMRRDEQRFARNYFWGGFHIGVVYALFGTMIAAVLAPQLAATFCPHAPEILERMLQAGSILIPLIVLGRYFTDLLRQMHGKYLVLGILAVYDIVFTVGVTVMLNAGNAGVMALIYAGILAEGLYTVIAGVLVCYQIRCGIEWLQGLAIPAGVACVTGLVILFVGKLITPHLGNPVTVIVCIVLAALLDWAGLKLMRNFRGQDMSYIPGGAVLHKVLRKLRIR